MIRETEQVSDVAASPSRLGNVFGPTYFVPAASLTPGGASWGGSKGTRHDGTQ